MSILHRLYYIVKRLKYIWKINIMQYPRKTITADREEFLPETVTHQEAGEQRLTVHRRNSRLYYLYLPPEIREMVYVENFFETHWLKRARFHRRNVPWPSVEFVREGALRVETREWETPRIVHAGSLLWIPPVCEATLSPGPEGFCRKVSLTLGGALLPAWQRANGFDRCRILPEIDRKEFELRLEEFRLLYEQQTEQALRENGVATWRLLQFLQSPYPVREIPERFLKLREKIRRNLHRPLTLAELSHDAQCTKIHLVREFRKYFGEPPHRMLRGMRMRLAATILLQRPELSIKEVAAQVGYDSALIFSSEFKRYHGESPRNFRNGAARSAVGRENGVSNS